MNSEARLSASGWPASITATRFFVGMNPPRGSGPLAEPLDEIARAPPQARPRSGILTLADDDVIGLQQIVAERVAAAPEIDAKRPIGLLAPFGDDLFARGLEALRPVIHREFVVARLALHLGDLEAVVDELLDHVGQRHEAVRAVPDVVLRERADRILLFRRGAVEIHRAARLQAGIDALREQPVVRDVLDHAVD